MMKHPNHRSGLSRKAIQMAVQCETLETRSLFAVATGTVTGVLFNDDNGSQVKDSVETVNAGRTVFIDSNDNGKLDSGEKSTTTDGNGRYTFSNLSAGTYHVERVLPAGYQLTSAAASPSGGVAVTAGNTTTLDIGSTAKALVHVSVKIDGDSHDAQVYADINQNNKFDAGDIAAVKLSGTGEYALALQPGQYHIAVATPAGTMPLTFQTVSLATAQSTSLTFNFNSTAGPGSSISGVLFNDDNFDGVLDNGETVNAGRVVYLDANHNGKLDSGETSVTTDSTGHYSFKSLDAGTYDVKRVLPDSAYRITTSTALVTVGDRDDATFNIGSTSKPATTPPPAQTGTLTGILFNDDNIDGELDNGETINAGRVVYLDTNENGKLDVGEQQTTTNSAGRYTFSNLAVGSYTVNRVLPAGYQVTNGITFNGVREQYVGVTAGGTTEANLGSTARAIIEGETRLTGATSGPDDPAAISGVRVYADLNKNGKFDSGEPSYISGQFARDEFTLGLPAGTYRITTDDPDLKPTGYDTSYADLVLGAGTTVNLTFTKPAVVA